MSTRSLFPTRFENTESSQVWPAHLPSPQKAMWTLTEQKVCRAPRRGEKWTKYVRPLRIQLLPARLFPIHMRGIWWLAPSQKETGIIWLNPQEMLWRYLPWLIFYTTEKNIPFSKRKKKKILTFVTLCTFIVSLIWGYQSTLGYTCSEIHCKNYRYS